MEQAIKQAKKGGYFGRIGKVRKTGTYYFVGDYTRVYFDGRLEKEEWDGSDRVEWTYKKNIFLDPIFWQALGKSLGWKGKGKSIYYKEFSGQTVYSANIELWEYYWHRFIDHLAEGQDSNSFFEELLK